MNRPRLQNPLRLAVAAVVGVGAAVALSTTMTACPADGPSTGEGEGEGESGEGEGEEGEGEGAEGEGEAQPGDEEARQRLLTDWETTLLLPTHEAFVTTSTALSAASVAFCADVSDAAAYAAVQQAWQAAHGSYKRIEVLRFGPIVAYPERYGPTVDFWPAREARIDALLDGDEVLTAELLATKGAVVRGLPVVEVLLWPFGATGNGQALYQDADDGARRCSFLTAATGDILSLATGLRDKWSPSSGGYVRQVTQPTAAGEFPTTKEAFSELINRMGFTVENIRRDKLARISAETIECSYSGRSIEAMRDNLSTVSHLFFGGDTELTTTAAEATATAALGVIDHPRLAERPDLIEAYATAQSNALTALAAIQTPFGVAVSEDRAGIAAADAALARLQNVIQVDLLNVLGVTLAFNDNDGD